MKITDIQQQKKRADRYSIFIDGKYSLSLSELELVASGLEAGQELTQQDIESYSSTSQLGKALDASYNYLSYRPRSIKELVDYLDRKHEDAQITEMVIQKLQQQKYLDDASFATTWVAERQEIKPASVQKLRVELLQKGIAKELIDNALSTIRPEDQVAAIKKLIIQKRLHAKYNDEQKLIRYLAGQGFRYSEIKQALEELV